MDYPFQEELQGNPAKQEDQINHRKVRAGTPRSLRVQAREPHLRVAQQQKNSKVHHINPGDEIHHRRGVTQLHGYALQKEVRGELQANHLRRADA